ncbi:MAG: HigA family addiction module antidote protein [Dermatophilaceae bacterium]|nr:HigA family addiction module antidote protein [Dermatophilaceae bacterium]
MNTSSMVEVRQHADGTTAVRMPNTVDDVVKGDCNWTAISWPDGILIVRLLTDDEVSDWKPLHASWTPDWSVHPGETLRETLHAHGLTQTAFAEKFGRPVQVINSIINGKKSITARTALDLEAALGISAEFWISLQANYNLSVARQRRATT